MKRQLFGFQKDYEYIKSYQKPYLSVNQKTENRLLFAKMCMMIKAWEQ